MGIYIPGVEMPKKEGLIYPIRICYDGKVLGYYGNVIGQAIELPPHGRLIDADAFAASYIADMPDAIHELKDKRKVPMFVNQIQALLKDIAEAPTIIPAEGGDAK